MTTELQEALAEIRAIHEDLLRISKSIQKLGPATHVERRAVPVKEAARLLSMGLTKINGLIRNGTIHLTDPSLGRLVPMSEIERLTVPAVTKRAAASGRKKTAPKAMSGAELKAWLKTKRGQ